MTPSVSIIIPIYNSAPFLEDCINSVLNQSYKNIEIILVDDGSTDDSSSIIDLFAKNDSRIEVIHQNNCGVSSARNNGLKRVKTEWIMFLDSDDTLVNDAVEKALQFADERIDLVILPFVNENTVSSNKLAYYDMKEYRKYFFGACRVQNPEYFPMEMRYDIKLTSQCAKLYRNSIIKKHNIIFPIDIKDNEDSFFNLHYVKYIDSAVFYDYQIYKVRLTVNSASRTFRNKGERTLCSLHYLERLLNELEIDMGIFRLFDGLFKIYQIIIFSVKQCISKEIRFWDAYKESRTYIQCLICKNIIRNLPIKDVIKIRDKIILLCLKMKLYLLVYTLFYFRYLFQK